MRFIVESDIGKKRTVNEDRATVLQHETGIQLAIVADGMGGHNAGDVASTMAVEGFTEAFSTATFDELVTNAELWLKMHVERINKEIYHYSLTHEDCQGMGTTVIVALIYKGLLTICHVGDSRLYVTNEREISQITKDHSFVNVLVESGEISEEEAATHPQKNYIIKSLGTEATIEPDYYQVQLLPYSYVLICSDGLSNKLSAAELHSILFAEGTLAEKAQEFVKRANAYGGEDNITCILFEYDQKEV